MLAECFLFVASLTYSSILKMEAEHSSETSLNNITTRFYIPVGRPLNTHPVHFDRENAGNMLPFLLS
jgi:hypothetical protein